jgi:hypothetical protein
MKRPFTKQILLLPCLAVFSVLLPIHADNPIIADVFTADPTAIVHDGTVYLYTEVAVPRELFRAILKAIDRLRIPAMVPG